MSAGDSLPVGRDPVLGAPVARLEALLDAAATGTHTISQDAPTWDEIATDSPVWTWVRDHYLLDDRERDVLVLALAPDIDPAYVTRLAMVQNDVAACRPSVRLVLQLAPPAERQAMRRMFRADGALLGRRLVTLVPDPRLVAPPLAAHAVVLDEQITDVLLDQGGLDRALAAVGRLSEPEADGWVDVPLPTAERDRLLAAAHAAAGRTPFRLHLWGPPGSGRRSAA